MKAVGIVAEYNPFHNGHKYMLDKAMSSSIADVSIAAISGNFSQRGEPTVLDKWTRAEMALKNGIDLVVEIPTIFACNNAGYFAKAGCEILDALKVESLAFGISVNSYEDINELGRIASYIKDNEEEIEAKLKSFVKDGISYPKARMIALNEMIGLNDPNLISSPNNILAIEYMKNTRASRVIPVFRKNVDYYDSHEKDGIASATHIREKLLNGEDVSNLVPKETLNMLNSEPLVLTKDKLFELIMHKLGNNPNMSNIFGLEEGLSNILKRDFRSFKTYDDIIESLKSKRYTRTRIERSLISLMLDITKQNIANAKNYIRILGFSDKGSKYLKEVKNEGINLPIITNINKDLKNNSEIEQTIHFDIMASDLYNMIAGKDLYANSDFVKHVVSVE